MLATLRPAFFASALIAAGVMSGEPTIFSCLRLFWTVERPLTPMTIAAIPNAISTAAATIPPISNAFRMTFSFRRAGAVSLPRPFLEVSADRPGLPSGRNRELSAASPRLICGFPVPRASAEAREKLPVLLEVAVAEELCAGAGLGVRAQTIRLCSVAQQRLDGRPEGREICRVGHE